MPIEFHEKAKEIANHPELFLMFNMYDGAYEALNELKGMPRINTDEIVKERVKIRINKGGHGISEEDIERRYVETFKNLKDVLKYCDLAAFYDNTKNFHRFAIFRNGEIARISTILPTWFKEKELVCSTNLSVSVSNKLL